VETVACTVARSKVAEVVNKVTEAVLWFVNIQEYKKSIHTGCLVLRLNES
jgi:hypothetical protein